MKSVETEIFYKRGNCWPLRAFSILRDIRETANFFAIINQNSAMNLENFIAVRTGYVLQRSRLRLHEHERTKRDKTPLKKQGQERRSGRTVINAAIALRARWERPEVPFPNQRPPSINFTQDQDGICYPETKKEDFHERGHQPTDTRKECTYVSAQS